MTQGGDIFKKQAINCIEICRESGKMLKNADGAPSFHMFKEGAPSASADFQGALRLHYNSMIY